MVSFCKCGADKVICQSCGRDMCSQGCDGSVKYIDTAVARGWYCHRCLAGPTDIHFKLRRYSESKGLKAMILRE